MLTSILLLGLSLAHGQTTEPVPAAILLPPRSSVDDGGPKLGEPGKAPMAQEDGTPSKQGEQPKVSEHSLKADQGGAENLPAPRETEPVAKALPAPELESWEEGLVISLPAALRLTDAGAWDIQIAVQQLQIAVTQRLAADVLWLPTLIAGVDYQYHSGPIQSVDGTLLNQSHSNMYAGGAPLAIFALTDAIFTPLAARQVVRAQDASIQAARNDTLTDMSIAYFNLLEAEADLASVMDVDRRATALVKKTEELAPALFGTVEVARARALKEDVAQIIETARQRWRASSAEVARLARLKPSVVLQPLEPPHARVTLVPDTLTAEQLIPIAVANRPELTFYEAQSRAAQERARQEKWRPFLPNLIARGAGTTPPYPMAVGVYGGGPGSDLNNFTQRSDWDLEAIWTLQNLGAGNVAIIRQREREVDLARSRQYRFRDIVAREVMVAWADLRSASKRVVQSEKELREAQISARQNLEGLGATKRPGGGINIPVIRPQEVVQSLQALNAAYFNYYGVIADYNRAQFRMYRALGNPAQMIAGHDGLCGPALQNDNTKQGTPNAANGTAAQ